MRTITIPSHQAASKLLTGWAQQIMESEHTKADETKADELFILARLFEFSTDDALEMTFPVTIELSEKPDFVFRFGPKTIGVEVTKFLAEQRARVESLIRDRHEDEEPSPVKPIAIYTTTPFNFNSPKRKNPDIVERMVPRQVGLTDWAPIPELVKSYAEELERIISDKTQKVSGNGLPAGSDLWLIVEDRMHVGKFNMPHVLQQVGEFVDASVSEIAFDTILFVLPVEKTIVGFKRNA
jgi:hypothetical protein